MILSNNDGCVIARSNEAKALGIAMGAPWFKIQHMAESSDLVALSANFALYGDLSDRMMSLVAGLGHQPFGLVFIESEHLAERAPHRDRILRGIDAVHGHLSAVGRHQGVQHAHGGGLAGAVRPEQAGDAAILGAEADIGHRLDTAGAGVEGLVQVVGDDHGAHPLNEVNAGT